MSGELWALLAGTGFGFFQTVNRRAMDGMEVFFATFIQLVISAFVLAGIALFTEDVGLLFTAHFSVILNFAAAGFFHFFIGWTFLNASQKKIGAARTSPLIGTTPLFATAIAALTLREFPSLLALLGIILIVIGAYVISEKSGGSDSHPVETGWRSAWLGLSAALCWAISPIFIRAGLKELNSPLLGVTVGSAVSALGYGAVLLWQKSRGIKQTATNEAWAFKIVAGILVGLSTWMRWIALGLAPVAVVLAISMVSTPVVILLSPIVAGKHLERVTVTLWMGAILILGGALLLTFISA
ncbi:MAG: DMT family transporter [Chloroflexi bacterium]|nr:DMT family transporter [Chloroflexota bacterium]